MLELPAGLSDKLTGGSAEKLAALANPKLHEFIAAKGYSFDGLAQKHHEIYLSDFRRTDPAKLKTIIRQPCVK